MVSHISKCDNLRRNASAPQLLEPEISKNREEPALQVAANSQAGHPWHKGRFLALNLGFGGVTSNQHGTSAERVDLVQ
jgi:hypothetical protein